MSKMWKEAPDFWMDYKNYRLSAHKMYMFWSPVHWTTYSILEYSCTRDLLLTWRQSCPAWHITGAGTCLGFFQSRNANKMLPIFHNSTCESFQIEEVPGRKMPCLWSSIVLQHHISLMYLFTQVAFLQPPRLSDHLLQSFNELISSMPFHGFCL